MEGVNLSAIYTEEENELNDPFHASGDSDADPHYLPSGEEEEGSIRNFTEDEAGVEVACLAEDNNNHAARDIVENEEPSDEIKKLTRKRGRNPDSWKRNINKKLCESGQAYKNVKGTIRTARKVKSLKDCENGCKYLCRKKISQSVFALPRANISCFFYSKKLNTFNLTAHCNINKLGYCAIWCEGTHGRKGIDIASALIRILENVLRDLPDTKRFILWSDSCVPQNKNSIMSMALLKFLEANPNIESITQKFCEPGHSSIQEIDNLHSQIEKKLKNVEIFSPLGLLRLLPTVNRKTPFKVFYMRANDFKEYQKAAEKLNFRSIPFASVKQVKFSSTNFFHVEYKLQHDGPSTKVSIVASKSGLRKQKETSSALLSCLPSVNTCKEPKESLLPFDKILHLKKLFKFMPPTDSQFISSFFKEYNNSKVFATALSRHKRSQKNEQDVSIELPSTSSSPPETGVDVPSTSS